MEQNENAFAAQKKRRKTRRILKACLGTLLAVVLLLIGVGAYRYLKLQNEGDSGAVSTLTYTAQRVTTGSVTTTLSASGTLSARETQTLYAGVSGTVEDVNVQTGDVVNEGDVLFTLTPDEDDALVQELEEAESTLQSTQRFATSLYLKANTRGVVKDLKLTAGADVAAVMEEYGYVCLVSTDSLMQTEVETEALSLYETVTLTTEAGKKLTGFVCKYENGVANILIDDISQPVGTLVTITDAEGNEVGTGTLQLVAYEKITAVDGLVSSVSVSDGSSVSRNTTIATFKNYPTTENYVNALEAYEELLEEYEEAITVTAPFTGKVLAVSTVSGEEVMSGDSLVTLQSDDGYVVTLSLDEEDVLSVAAGQKVELELDALEGTYEGEISLLSYVNSGSNNARYQATVAVEDIEQALPGMGVTCTIVLSDSGEGLLVPAEAIQTSNGKTVVYLAPEGATFGTVYGETEVDLTTLTAVEVEILASDGSYLLISGDIAQGDMVLVQQRTTSATYEAEDAESLFGAFNQGGFGGGNFGGDMGSFDFGGGNMPSMPDMGNSGNSGNNSNNGGNRSNGGNRGERP